MALLNIDLLFPAAGRGRRLGGKSIGRPKCLVDLGFDSTSLSRISSSALNFRRVCVVAGFSKRRLRKTANKSFSGSLTKIMNNLDWKKNHCASSMCVARRIFYCSSGLLIWNSDLVVSDRCEKAIIRSILADRKKQSIVFGISGNAGKYDFQQLKTEGGIISKWDLEVSDFEGYVTGPIFLSKNDSKKISFYLQRSDVKKLPCFTFLSSLLGLISYKFVELYEKEVHEFDEPRDIKNLKKSKIHKRNQKRN